MSHGSVRIQRAAHWWAGLQLPEALCLHPNAAVPPSVGKQQAGASQGYPDQGQPWPQADLLPVVCPKGGSPLTSSSMQWLHSDVLHLHVDKNPHKVCPGRKGKLLCHAARLAPWPLLQYQNICLHRVLGLQWRAVAEPEKGLPGLR